MAHLSKWSTIPVVVLHLLTRFAAFTSLPLLQISAVAPPEVKLPFFCMRHSQPLNAACERLWPCKCALRGKEKVKLSYWIDWTFMKLKCALPPASSHVEMTSRHLQRPVWNTAVRIPTLQSGAELLPCRHNSIVKSLMSRAGGFNLPLTISHMRVFDFIGIIAQLFYTASYFVITLCLTARSCINRG